jgi:CRISPR system Cascade subunit CasD
MPEFLLVRLEGPMQAWGDVAVDGARPTRRFPSRSALAGLLASALGWTYRDGARTTALQDALRVAVRADDEGTVVTDYQTAELATVTRGWTRRGVEARDLGNVLRTERVYGRAPRATSTQQLWKRYLADASFLAAVGLRADAPVTLDALAAALARPARPLFLGRRACPPARPLLEGRVNAPRPYDALMASAGRQPVRCWYEPADGPERSEAVLEMWDRRDFLTDRFVGSRTLVEGTISCPEAS